MPKCEVHIYARAYRAHAASAHRYGTRSCAHAPSMRRCTSIPVHINSCAHHACAQACLRPGIRMPRATSVGMPVHVSMTCTGKHTRSMQWVSAPGSRSKSLWHSHNTAVGPRHIHQLRRSGFPLRPPDARPRTRFAIFRRRHQPCLAFHRGFFLLMT